MDPTFSHPLWISSGILMIVAGLVLFLWARRLGASNGSSNATRGAAAGQIFRGQKSSKPAAPGSFRKAMSQLFGIIGFLLMIAGLMAIFLGAFYVGS